MWHFLLTLIVLQFSLQKMLCCWSMILSKEPSQHIANINIRCFLESKLEIFKTCFSLCWRHFLELDISRANYAGERNSLSFNQVHWRFHWPSIFFFFQQVVSLIFFFPFVISFNLQSSEIKNALKIAKCPCYLFIEDLICQSLNCIPRSFIIVPELFQIVKLKVQ